jgi:hypothetical protein
MLFLISALIAAPQYAFAQASPTTAKLCQIENYENIGLAYYRLTDKLNSAISYEPNSAFVEIATSPMGEKVRIYKPIKLPADRLLEQVGQQQYAVCLIVETIKP